MHDAAIAIVISAFNAGCFIYEAIESVCSETT